MALKPHFNLHHQNILYSHRNIPPTLKIISSSSHLLEAAKLTVDNYVKSGMIVGFGSGLASSFAIRHLGHKLCDGSLTNILGIPTSLSSATEAEKAGISIDKHQDKLQIDFAFIDADTIEAETLASIIGRRKIEGDDSIIKEKSILKAASNVAFIVEEKQYTNRPEGSIPVFVKTDTWMETAEQIDDLYVGDAEVWRRPTYGHAGPNGGDFPLVTKDGHYVLDVIFTSPILDIGQVAKDLEEIEGVVDHGVICKINCRAIVASETGAVIIKKMSNVHI